MLVSCVKKVFLTQVANLCADFTREGWTRQHRHGALRAEYFARHLVRQPAGRNLETLGSPAQSLIVPQQRFQALQLFDTVLAQNGIAMVLCGDNAVKAVTSSQAASRSQSWTLDNGEPTALTAR